MATALWAPNQAAIAQVETYTFSAPSGVGNWYQATINGKTLTYTSVSGDTATTAATAMYNLLNQSTGVAPELLEIQFANPSAGVVTATARTPGTPFANVTVNGVANQGLVMSTGNGLVNGIATAHTTANASPSDVFDAANWLRVTAPAPGVRSLPINGDLLVVANTSVPMLWNLDRLSTIQFGTPYLRYQSFTGTIGLPENNPGGYQEWRATYFKFNGPQGSVPAGGLQMILGYDGGAGGNGPSRERYDLQSSQYSLTLLAAGTPTDDYGVRMLGQHTANTFASHNGTSLAIANLPGETAKLSSCNADGGSVVGIGAGVTWTAASTLSLKGAQAVLASAPAVLALSNAAIAQIATDGLTWASITAQGGSGLQFLAGGIITALTLSTGSTLDKSLDSRALTITDSTIDGDTCVVNDPLNCITWTNPTSVKQQVSSGPFLFTGTRTVRVL